MVQKLAGHRYILAHGEIGVVVQQLIYQDSSMSVLGSRCWLVDPLSELKGSTALKWVFL